MKVLSVKRSAAEYIHRFDIASQKTHQDGVRVMVPMRHEADLIFNQAQIGVYDALTVIHECFVWRRYADRGNRVPALHIAEENRMSVDGGETRLPIQNYALI